jgi:hypothetical protein
MSENEHLLEIVFRGDIAPGETVAGVKARVAQLFRIDEQRADQLFSGRPTVLKRNLDRQKAEQFQQALAKAGAVVEMRLQSEVVSEEQVASEEQTASSETESAGTSSGSGDESGDESEWSLSPVGSDLLSDNERKTFVEANINVDHLTLGEAGDDVLNADEKQPFVERQIDLSHLSLDD